jgi:hypothetical protein
MAKPKLLDDAKRREICALLTAGYPMYAAADYVGCSARTIKREIRRNTEFGDRVRRAAIAGQLDPLSTVRNAARSDWRAAAWYLERTNPDQFVKRNPVLIKPEDMLEQMEGLAEKMLLEVKDGGTRDRILHRMFVAAALIKKAVADHSQFDGRNRPVPINAAENSRFPDMSAPDEIETMLNGGEFAENGE